MGVQPWEITLTSLTGPPTHTWSPSATSGASDVGRSENPTQLMEGSGSVRVLKNQVVTLQPLSATWDKHTPFIVASAPGNLISGHNDIYNPNFVLPL